MVFLKNFFTVKKTTSALFSASFIRPTSFPSLRSYFSMDQFLVLVGGILSHILGKKEGHDLLTSFLHRFENIALLRPNSPISLARKY